MPDNYAKHLFFTTSGSMRIYYTAESMDFYHRATLWNLTSKGGDNMMIDFDEQKFKKEIKAIAKKYGASSNQAKMVVSAALSAVYNASERVDQ